MKKIKDILNETKEKTMFHVKQFVAVFEKHKVFRFILSAIFLVVVGLSVAFCSGRKNSETAEASEFQSNGGYVALNDNPCWYYGFSTGESFPTKGSLPYKYLSSIVNRGNFPTDIQINVDRKQTSPMNMIFNYDISTFCRQINIDNSRPMFTYGDNFTERFLPKVYPITKLTSCRNSETTQDTTIAGNTITVNTYLSEFYYAQTPFYDYYDVYWQSNPSVNKSFEHYIGFFTIYESFFAWDTSNTILNRYRIQYPEYSFFFIVPNSCIINYDNYNPNILDYSLSTVSVAPFNGSGFRYTLTYGNGLKFTFDIQNFGPFSVPIKVRAVAIGNHVFQPSVPYKSFLTVGSKLVLGFDNHTITISSSDAASFSNGYEQGYAKALSDYSAIEQKNIDNAVQKAVENYNNTIYVDSESYSAGYATGEQHADNRVNKDSASYQAGLTAGADIAGLTPFQFIVNSVNTFLNTPLFSVNGWSFTLSYLIYISLGLLLIGILIKTFWGG